MASTSSPLGPWVEMTVEHIFFQSDDEMAVKSLGEYLAPDLVAKINHDTFNHAQYIEAVKGTRARDTLTMQTNDEVQIWTAPDGSGVAAHVSTWTQKNKATGVETKASGLTVSEVKIRDGKRVIVALTEVMNFGA